MMDIKLSLGGTKSALSHFLRRFHIVIFVVFALGSLSAGVYILNEVVVTADQKNGYTSTINITTFDTDTIKQLELLKEKGETTESIDTKGRTNPFSE
jgi:hypothetical protein